MTSIKQGSQLLPVSLLEKIYDATTLKRMAVMEFYHMQEAMRYYRSQETGACVSDEDNMRIFCQILDCHLSRWGGRPVDYTSEVLAKIPDYGEQGDLSTTGRPEQS